MKYSLLLLVLVVLIFSQANTYAQQVAVIDSGIMRDAPQLSSIYKMGCWSRQDQLTNDSVNPSEPPNPIGNNYFDYEYASTCKEENNVGLFEDFTQHANKAQGVATVPRITYHWNEYYDNHYFGFEHGSNVANMVIRTVPSAQIIAINTAYYNYTKESNGVECGIHGPHEDDYSRANSHPEEFPSNTTDCYSFNVGGALGSPAVASFIHANGADAINVSAGDVSNCSEGSDYLSAFNLSGVAVVAAAGNGGASAPVSWPACNPNVISVGAFYDNGSTRTISVKTSLNGIIDFFANGNGFHYKTGNLLDVATSFAAPIVSAAFAKLRHAKPSASVDQIKHALISAAVGLDKTLTHNGRGVPIVDETVINAALQCLVDETCLINEGAFEVIGYYDGGQYGEAYDVSSALSAYEFEINFQNLSTGVASIGAVTNNKQVITQAENITVVPSKRDVVLTFTGKMTTYGHKPFRVRVNGVVVNTLYNYYSAGEEKTFSFVINRNTFNSSINTITIEPRYSNYDWGVKNISAEFTPIVPLQMGVTDTNSYGYDGVIERYTGLRTSFDVSSVESDYALSVTGWDIDAADETQVFLNGESIGYLSWNPDSSEYSARDTFILRQADLLTGTNIVEFVQRTPGSGWSGYQDEKWFVTDLLVQEAKPDLTITSVGIIDRILQSNVPFQVSANISNIGIGASSVTVVKFYASTDQTISSNDTLLASVSFASLNENASRSVSASLQTTLVNQGLHFGACVTSLAIDSNANNNCSAAVRLSSQVSIAPILMLLLDDD